MEPSRQDANTNRVDSHNGRGRRWVWWLLPIIVLLSVAAARWGIHHIEKQVLASAPAMLRSAGVDPAGLSFELGTDTRDP